jgi:hypothetical protein
LLVVVEEEVISVVVVAVQAVFDPTHLFLLVQVLL